MLFLPDEILCLQYVAICFKPITKVLLHKRENYGLNGNVYPKYTKYGTTIVK